MLDFRIYTFLAVCEHMNYTKAAEELHITQPAVSQHIKYLEDLYETKLFQHEGKHIELSSSGIILYQHAIAVKNDEQIMIEQMHRIHPNTFSFHFGVTMTVGEYEIARPLAKYLQHHPNTKIDMHFSNTMDILTKLHSGELNFALMEGYFNEDEYASITFSTEDYICVASSGHQFEKKPVYLSDLLGEHLIVREKGSGTRSILEKNLDTHDIRLEDFNRITEIGSMHAIIDFIKSDCGITFLYKLAAQKELDSGELVEIKLKDFQMNHNFTFIWNKGSMYSETYKKICHELQGYKKTVDY